MANLLEPPDDRSEGELEDFVPPGCTDPELAQEFWVNVENLLSLPRRRLFLVLNHAGVCSACYLATLTRYEQLCARRRSKAERASDGEAPAGN